MRIRAFAVVALAAVAFLALYAVGQAGEDDGGSLTAPAAIETDMDQPAKPPKLDAGAALPGLKPARRPAAASSPAPAETAPAPAPAAPAKPAPKAASCDLDTSGLGEVKSWVGDAAQFLGCAFGQPDMLGVGSRGNASDHPDGKALDLMTSDPARGDAIAECALANRDELGVTYVIWNQRINTGSGWESMEDRGGDTANHKDHVHISFEDSAGSGTPDLGRCA